jgi:hypothetical protein
LSQRDLGLVRARRARFRRANETAHDLPFDLLGEGDVNPRPSEKRHGVFARVDPSRLDARIPETDFGEHGDELVLLESARDTPRPERHARFHFFWQASSNDDVAHRESPARPQHTE